MRTVGRELGVEAMSLYDHITGKDDMIHAFSAVDAYVFGFVLSELNLPMEPGESAEEFVQGIELLTEAYPNLAEMLAEQVIGKKLFLRRRIRLRTGTDPRRARGAVGAVGRLRRESTLASQVDRCSHGLASSCFGLLAGVARLSVLSISRTRPRTAAHDRRPVTVVAAVCALAWVVTRVLPCDGRAVEGPSTASPRRSAGR
jgi:hypothetical protein